MKIFRTKKSIDALKLELKQKKVTELLEAMLSYDVEIHFAPISGEYFIVDDTNHINVSLSNTSVKIANHKYLYEVNFSLGSMEKYMKMAKEKVEERANRIKKELFSNEIHLIGQITKMYKS